MSCGEGLMSGAAYGGAAGETALEKTVKDFIDFFWGGGGGVAETAADRALADIKSGFRGAGLKGWEVNKSDEKTLGSLWADALAACK